MTSSTTVPIPQPTSRRLRVYAFDPNASLDLGSAKFSHATIALAWSDPAEAKIEPGPINDYLEVIDIDPCSRQFYPPLDLDAPEVLGQDGLPPSEGDPRFHQQMVFAVAMKTIKLFERALGRKVIWAPTWDDVGKTYVPTLKLRVYPHALREANAYYSREKRALLFGYFRATQRKAGASWIFTALSHDIIVHETTHAILDGLHPRYSEPTSVDSLAFHEAFADIAALFSHFQLYEAVYDYIEKNAGHLDQAGLLSGLAGQFAKGTSGHPSLRDFIDEEEPDPNLLEGTMEPHDRGSILVAAVFDAFLSIYSARTGDLLRMCGVQMGASGPLHPDLVARLAKEATKSADHVLRMCIRALDYLPPVDVHFGEFLRAIVTADADLIPDDRLNYRLAFVEAFRRRGIFPENCLSMSPDNLLWDAPPGNLSVSDIDADGLNLIPQYKRAEIVKAAEDNRRKVWYWLTQPELVLTGSPTKTDIARFEAFRLNARAVLANEKASSGKRLTAFLADVDADLAWLGVSEEHRRQLAADLVAAPTHFARWEAFASLLTDPQRTPEVIPDPKTDRAWERALGILFERPKDKPYFTIGGGASGLKIEVASVRTTRRAGPDGQDIRQLVIEVMQRRQGYFAPEAQARHDGTSCYADKPPRGDFVFRGGATMIIDLRDNKLRYVISKRITDDERLEHQRQHLLAPEALGFTYDPNGLKEPFAMLHRM